MDSSQQKGHASKANFAFILLRRWDMRMAPGAPASAAHAPERGSICELTITCSG